MALQKRGSKVYDTKTGYTVYGVEDMWKVFVEQYLANNPGSWVKTDKQASIYKLVSGKPVFVIDYITFTAVLRRGNDLYKEKIIEGKKINLLNSLGGIYGAVLDTNPKRFIPDWGTYKKTGELTVRHQDTYAIVLWKKFCKIKNEKVYEFVPSRGKDSNSSGFVQMFYGALRKNPLLQLKYVRIKNK